MTTPEHLKSMCGSARLLWSQGRFDEARSAYDRVLALDPAFAPAIEGIGLVTLNVGDPDDAARLFEQALAIEPERLTSMASLADVYKDQGRHEEARALVERVLARRPDLKEMKVLLGEILWAQGDRDRAMAIFAEPASGSDEIAAHVETLIFQAVMVADWRGYGAARAFVQRRARAGKAIWQAALPLLMLDDAGDLHRAARAHAARYVKGQPALWTGASHGHGKIRVAFLTADAFDHPIGHAVAAVLERIDRTRFETSVYSYGADAEDDVRARIAAAAGAFVDVGALDDLAVARRLRSDEIDIAVTINGYGGRARPGILAHRPAPAQASYLGYPGTLGASYIDYLIADREVIPETDVSHYSEKIVWMPTSCLAIDSGVTPAPAIDRAAAGLPDEAFVFMAPAPQTAPDTFEAWMRILGRIKRGVLWLETSSEDIRENLRREAERHGVDPARLVFADDAPRAVQLARYGAADLMLDTAPYGVPSACADALISGLPVLTCRGGAFAGRITAGLLTQAGLAGLVAGGLAEYQDRAVALASDPDWLATLRKRTLEARGAGVFDPAAHVRSLEDAFAAMHRAAEAGQPPQAIVVEARA